MLNVTLVGANDGQLEGLLRTAGAHVNTIDPGRLAKLAGAAAAQPDVIVLDIRREKTIPPATAAIKRQHPDTAFIIMTAALDPGLLVEAMRAGVTEVLNEPLAQADLERALARVAGHRAAGASGMVAFVGAKGGVGTTTIAVNVATVLGTMRRPVRTLLIDLHPKGGDAAVLFGVEPRFSVMDALENTHRLDVTFLHGLVTEAAPGVDLLPSSDRAVTSAIDAAKVRALLDFVATTYTYVVLDVPRDDSAMLDALDRVGTIAVVTSQELAAVRSASRMVPSLKQRYGPNAVSLVLSRSDRRADISQEDIEHAVGTDIAFTFPSDYRAAVHAMNIGKPLALAEKTDLAGAFRQFVDTLVGAPGAERTAAPHVGLIGRMTHAI